MAEWEADLAVLPLAQVVREAGGPGGVALHVVDLIVGFCDTGRLASPRIAAIVFLIVDLPCRAHAAGVKHFLLIQDAHPEGSPEFEAFGPHCVVGTPEAKTVPELDALPFSNQFLRIPKTLDQPLHRHRAGVLDGRSIRRSPGTSSLATAPISANTPNRDVLKMRANALMLEHEVLVPEDCVQTYDFRRGARAGNWRDTP